MNIIIKLIFIFGFFLSDAKASVMDPFYDELEGYELVAALLRDQKLDLAESELKSERLKKSNPSRYHILLGQLYYAKGLWKKSISEFNLYPSDVTSKVYLGRNYFEVKDFKKCSQSYQQIDKSLYAGLDSSGSVSTGLIPATDQKLMLESDFLKKANCEFKIKSYPDTFLTLSEGQNQFKSFVLYREKIAFKLKLGLIHEALVYALDQLAGNVYATPVQFLDIAELFHQQGHLEESLSVLEMGRSAYPTHMDLNLSLSQMYFQKSLLQASEEGFARASLTDGKYYYHTAELNRQIGRLQKAQYFNSYVQDDQQKLKQKIATYVDSNKFNLISSLKSVIQRSELNKDDEIKYALAYSLVKVGEVELPLKYLDSIRKPELLEKTKTLKNAVLECQIKNQSCHY